MHVLSARDPVHSAVVPRLMSDPGDAHLAAGARSDVSRSTKLPSPVIGNRGRHCESRRTQRHCRCMKMRQAVAETTRNGHHKTWCLTSSRTGLQQYTQNATSTKNPTESAKPPKANSPAPHATRSPPPARRAFATLPRFHLGDASLNCTLCASTPRIVAVYPPGHPQAGQPTGHCYPPGSPCLPVAQGGTGAADVVCLPR